MIHIVVKEREGDTPDVYIYENEEAAIEEVRYTKMMQNYIKYDNVRLFEANELDTESIPPMTKNEIEDTP